MSTIPTAFRLDEEIIPSLKKIAKEQDRSVNWLVNNTLKNFIQGNLKVDHTVGNPPSIKIERPKDIPTINTKIEIIEGVKVSENEITKLKEVFGEGYLWAIETLSNYKLSSGKKYKSDYHALIGWVKTKYDEQITKSKTTGINGLTPADIRMANWLRQGSNS